MVQSGGTYDLSANAESNDEVLKYDVIIASLGARYQGYCSWVTRTYFVDATDEQRAVYEVLCHAHAAAVHALKPGQPLAEVYSAAQKSIAASDRPDLAQYLSSRVGNGIGLEFREHLFLSAKEKRHAKANMTFSLSLGFANVPHKGAKAGKSGAQSLTSYSVQVGDVVHLRKKASEKTGEWADVLTGGKMNWNAVHFQVGLFYCIYRYILWNPADNLTGSPTCKPARGGRVGGECGGGNGGRRARGSDQPRAVGARRGARRRRWRRGAVERGEAGGPADEAGVADAREGKCFETTFYRYVSCESVSQLTI